MGAFPRHAATPSRTSTRSSPTTSRRCSRAGSWSGVFAVEYARLNSFHTALVVEAQADGLHALVAGTDITAATFLSHLTIGVWHDSPDPAPLRAAVVPLRGVSLGTAAAVEAKRIRFPAACTTVLEPWRVIELVPL